MLTYAAARMLTYAAAPRSGTFTLLLASLQREHLQVFNLLCFTSALLALLLQNVHIVTHQREHLQWHRRNVRWNSFVKTYLEDAVAEVEHADGC